MYSQRWLDLVALGTVADLAPLIGENRTLVHTGLKVIQSGRRLGLRVLANIAGIRISTIAATDIGFTLGPRLNAAGRLKTAMDAFHLLVTEDESEALPLAQNLNHSNTERQEMTRETQQKSVELVADSLESDYLLFVVDPQFNEGIVGLAASRLAEQFYRPSVVGKIDEATTRCSCRSIPEFHITNALDECRDLLVRHGGHAAAAGFTVDNTNLAELVSRLKSIAHRELHDTELIPTYHADAEIPMTELDRVLSDYLDQLQPTGYGNPEPYFVSRGVKVFEKKKIGTEGKHLKMKLSTGLMKMDAIAFNFGYLTDAIPEQIDIFYTFEKNAFNGYVNLQVRIKDIQFSE
jgi:single-stranded-DNA-specific exonuclease